MDIKIQQLNMPVYGISFNKVFVILCNTRFRYYGNGSLYKDTKIIREEFFVDW